MDFELDLSFDISHLSFYFEIIMLRRKSIRFFKGFTLIELLVSVAIIALMSSIFMVNYHGANKRSELNVTKQKLASDIRVAQNNSLGSKAYNAAGDTPSGGWGVHFDIANPSSYIIFADINANQTYDAGEGVDTKILPAGVTINLISPMRPDHTLDIIFFPPDPVVYINSKVVNDLDSATARIELKENINNSTGAVTVNFFGLIDTE